VYLSILIPVLDQAEQLRKLLATILTPENSALPFEVIVCDDGSSEPLTVASPVRLIRHDVAHGASAARNTAASEAQGQVFLFLDADTLLLRGSISHVIARFQVEPDLAAINGGAHLEPADPESGFAARYRALIDHVQQNIRAPQTCSFFTTRCGAIRKELFLASGRFNERFRGATVEDYEFGHRLAGLAAIRFDPKISIQHHYGGFKRICRNYFTRVRGWTALFVKRPNFDNYGSATGAAGIGSIMGVLWLPALLLPAPMRSIAAAISFGGFFLGYRDIFFWSYRLKGLLFLVRTVAITWFLCWVIVAAAVLGALQGIISTPVKEE